MPYAVSKSFPSHLITPIQSLSLVSWTEIRAVGRFGNEPNWKLSNKTGNSFGISVKGIWFRTLNLKFSPLFVSSKNKKTIESINYWIDFLPLSIWKRISSSHVVHLQRLLFHFIHFAVCFAQFNMHRIKAGKNINKNTLHKLERVTALSQNQIRLQKSENGN